ncbi:MAG TPA: hypothetical protein VGJ97_12380 [Anaerolineaceae bacterium]
MSDLWNDDAVHAQPLFLAAAYDLVGIAASAGDLRAAEILGHHFLNLEITRRIHRILTGEWDTRESYNQATNRRGKLIDCRITVIPLVGLNHKIGGTLILFEDGPVSEKV